MPLLNLRPVHEPLDGNVGASGETKLGSKPAGSSFIYQESNG